jgi:tight adherence protein C
VSAGARLARALASGLAGALGSALQIRGVSPPADLQRLLTAGPAKLGLREWLVLKLLCAGCAGIGAVFLCFNLSGRMALLAMLAAPAGGFLAPDLWLSRLLQRRTDAAVRELPDMLDLLRITIAAGMPPARALGVVAAEFGGPLAHEWRRVSAELSLGLSEEEAVTGLAARLPADEIHAFVRALTRARRQGAPLAGTLGALSSRARDRRRERVREQAARAGPKIQLVVALVLVPAVLALIAAVLVSELQRSGLLVPL